VSLKEHRKNFEKKGPEKKRDKKPYSGVVLGDDLFKVSRKSNNIL
jgi:hypothetical protein